MLAGYRAVRPLLFRIDLERIHHATIAGLRVAGRPGAGRDVTLATALVR